MIEATVIGLERDEGTIVVFSAVTEDGGGLMFACDHHYAQDIVNGLADQEEEVFVALQPWQIIGRFDV